MSEADDRTRALGRETARPRSFSGIQAGRLWAGGVATAVIAALIALVGLLILQVLLQIPYLAPAVSEPLDGWAAAQSLTIWAAIAGLAATGLAHLLLVTVPSPMSYFGWIAGLLTALAAVSPLILAEQPWTVRIATAVIHLVIGMSIISLVTTTVTSATNRV